MMRTKLSAQNGTEKAKRNTENSKQHSFFCVMTNGNYPIILENVCLTFEKSSEKMTSVNWIELNSLGSFARRPFSIAHTHLATSFDLSVQYTSISEQCESLARSTQWVYISYWELWRFPLKKCLTDENMHAYASTDCWLCTAHRHVHTRPQE